MFLTHIYFNGQCRTAIELYKKAFDAEVQMVLPNPEHDDLVLHAEILIHNQLFNLMILVAAMSTLCPVVINCALSLIMKRP